MSSHKYSTNSYLLQPLYAIKVVGRSLFVSYYNITQREYMFDQKEFALLHFDKPSVMKNIADSISDLSGERLRVVRVGCVRKYKSFLDI